MSADDDRGAGQKGSGQSRESRGDEVNSQLLEALIFMLIEKGLLTKKDALSIVQTVAQVQQGSAVEWPASGGQAQANIVMLRRLYASFNAIAEKAGSRLAKGDNVHQLRPSIYGERPEFPRDD